MTCPRCHGHGCWPVDAYDQDAKPLEVANGHEPDLNLAIRQLNDLTLAELDKALERLDQARRKADEDPLWLALERQARHRLRPLWSRQLRGVVLGLPQFQRFLVGWFYIDQIQPPNQCHAPFDRRLDEALDLIHDRLPVSFAAPAWVRDQAERELAAETALAATTAGRWATPADRAGRDREVLRLHAIGWSARAIGKRLGVAKDTTRRVIERAA
jgi:hypothetical protein